MAARIHKIKFTATDVVVDFIDDLSGSTVDKSLGFALPWATTAALTDESVNYSRSSSVFSVVITRQASSSKRLVVTTKETINLTTNTYCQTTLTLTPNESTPANWDMTTQCVYSSNIGPVNKQATNVQSNITTASMNTTEMACDYETLIASNVNMFIVS